MVDISSLTKHIWLIFIIAMGINAAIFRHSSKQHIKENPELAAGYSTIIRGFLFWGNIPWIVMGIGCTFGNIQSIFSFFKPSDGNPYVQAFFGSVFLIWILGTYWVFFRDGAEMLASHPGILRINVSNPLFIKIYWLVSVIGGIIAVFLIYTYKF